MRHVWGQGKPGKREFLETQARALDEFVSAKAALGSVLLKLIAELPTDLQTDYAEAIKILQPVQKVRALSMPEYCNSPRSILIRGFSYTLAQVDSYHKKTTVAWGDNWVLQMGHLMPPRSEKVFPKRSHVAKIYSGPRGVQDHVMK